MLQALIYPLPLALLAMLLGTALALRWRGIGVIMILAALGFLWGLASEPGARYLAGGLERDFPPVAAADLPAADAILILGGGVHTTVPPRIEAQLARAGDRVRLGHRLYQAGRAPVLVVSGGTLAADTVAHQSQAMATAELLRQWGVPAASIMSLGQRLSTRDEALQMRDLMRERGYRRILLVTSATHMPRALATFHSLGIEAIPAPADHLVPDGPLDRQPAWIPASSRLEISTRAWHEYLGIAWYRHRGWIQEPDP